MNWQIQVPNPKYSFDLSHKDKVFSIGSCFAKHIADRLCHYKFYCINNPYGILFHPKPILKNLLSALKDEKIDDTLFLKREDGIFHYSCHSSLWGDSKDDLKKRLQELQSFVSNELIESNILILTFGTAFLYQLASSGKSVANCHKQSNHTFTKVLSSPDDIQTVFRSFYSELKKKNPKIQIILTVSPVRHIRDGIHESNLSKSVLLLACDKIQKLFEDVHYFPAYEIVIDQLRDYRFYSKDRVHPNDEAQDYVWSKFVSTLLTKDSLNLNNDLDKLFSSISHKPFRESSDSHQRFLKQTFELAQALNEKVNLEKELIELKSRMQ